MKFLSIILAIAFVAMAFAARREQRLGERSRNREQVLMLENEALSQTNSVLKTNLASAKLERAVFAAAYLQAADAEAACEKRFEETFTRRFYASAE